MHKTKDFVYESNVSMVKLSESMIYCVSVCYNDFCCPGRYILIAINNHEDRFF